MTRETKIGLLVGLAFIIVIGILLSDHFRGAQEPAPAMLDRAGATVRATVNAPGANGTSPAVVMAPEQTNPRGTVPTPRDLEPAPGPIVLQPSPPAAAGLPANDPVVQAAKARGEELVPADASSTGVAMQISQRTYRAQSGDSVSRMAARLLGANTRQNRQAIIQANPSLAADPNKVIVGQEYVIPAKGGAISSIPAIAGATSSGAQWSYTVKSGDTLWGIATGQLGTAGAIAAIKELNRDLLHGGTTLRAGMKLRLPSQPLAIAD